MPGHFKAETAVMTEVLASGADLESRVATIVLRDARQGELGVRLAYAALPTAALAVLTALGQITAALSEDEAQQQPAFQVHRLDVSVNAQGQSALVLDLGQQVLLHFLLPADAAATLHALAEGARSRQQPN